MNKKAIFRKSLDANKKLIYSLTKEQLEELMSVFDEYETKQLSIDGVSGSLSDLDGKTLPVKFKVSRFKPNINIDDDLAK